MIKTLNQALEMNIEEVETMIAELVERNEYTCSAYIPCGADVCGIN